MYCGCEAGEALEDGVGGGVEKLIGNAIDAAICNGAQRLPAALLDDTRQRNAVSGAAPGEDRERQDQLAAMSSAVVVLPASPTNSPPAASTSSFTQGCEWMSGLPHSSQ